MHASCAAARPYRYIHDQTLRLANHGYTGARSPRRWSCRRASAASGHNRGYYGTLNHNAKAVYQRYLGWFDGNPANLHPLPPVEAAKKYVEYLGGADAVLAKAAADYAAGEYRWVAEVVNHVVFADPDNQAAKNLQADALEQLGYQAEAGPWRNFYLTGAQELRYGVADLPAPRATSPDTLRGMTPEMVFDYLAIRLNGPDAAGEHLRFNVAFTDTGQTYLLEVTNGVLVHTAGRQDPAPTPPSPSPAATRPGDPPGAEPGRRHRRRRRRADRRPAALERFLGLLDDFPFWFNIVTP